MPGSQTRRDSAANKRLDGQPRGGAPDPHGISKLTGLLQQGCHDAAGCHPGGPGGGKAPDRSGDSFGRDDGGRRMIGHGDLKLLTLALIEQAPRHGYELIRLIGDIFHGQYAPSPGAIYPTLGLLEASGQIELGQRQGGRKLYGITATGRAFLDDNRATVEMVAARTSQRAREAAKRSLPPSVRDAMSSLKHALLMRANGWTAAEARRVAAILARAAREIAGGRA